jgi:hypothetical protein
MSDFEKLLMNIILSAGEKIIDAAVLLRTGHSYRDAWYLTILAEEELAKIVVLPFAERAGNSAEIAERPSVLYSHPVKQKIFTTYGLQNRDYSSIEALKQECIYVAPKAGGRLRVVMVDEASGEIEKSILLFNQLAVNNILIAQTPSNEFKITLQEYAGSVFMPAVKDLVPSVAQKIMADFDGPTSKITTVEAVKRHPLLFAEMIVFAIPQAYQQFFADIQGLSHTEMIEELDKYFS